MGVPNRETVSAEDFIDWNARQDERHELVRGWPVRLMTGAKQSHNVVVGNLADAMRSAAKAAGCRTTTSDTAVVTGPDQVRYPDIVVDCGPPDPDALAAAHPTIVVEVLSPTTSQIDLTDKLDEYRALSGLEAILLVDPDVVSIKLYRRGAAGGWTSTRHEALADAIELPRIGARVGLDAIYDTLRPKVRPRIVEPASEEER